MSEDPGQNWISFREYVERMWGVQKEALERRESELDRRLVELNQLRDEVLTDRARFITRDLYDAKYKELQSQIDDLKRSRSIMVGVGLVLVPIAGVVGAAVTRMFG